MTEKCFNSKYSTSKISGKCELNSIESVSMKTDENEYNFATKCQQIKSTLHNNSLQQLNADRDKDVGAKDDDDRSSPNDLNFHTFENELIRLESGEPYRFSPTISISPISNGSSSPVNSNSSLADSTTPDCANSSDDCDEYDLSSEYCSSMSNLCISNTSSPNSRCTSEMNITSFVIDNDCVSLEELNIQIGTPQRADMKPAKGLETIFEGIFLETPPPKRSHSSHKQQKPKFRRSLLMAMSEKTANG